MKRGEYWLAVWPNDPGKKPRPVLVVSNDLRNSRPHIPDVVVVKLTSLERGDGTIKTVNAAEDVIVKLKKDSIIRCGAIYAVEKSFLIKTLGTADTNVIFQVNEKLRTVLQL